MDVDALRTFITIHRAGGVTRAAAALFRSQPAVSRRLGLLEKQLGIPLFERVTGGVVLTEAGRTLLPFAEAVLAALQDAEAAVQAVQSGDRGRVTMALVGTLASTSLTSVLRRFAQRHPKVRLTLRTATSHEVSDLVRRSEVTLGLRYSKDPAPELHCETLFSEQLVVAAATDHPLVSTGCDGLSALAGEQWIAFPELPGRPEASAAYVRRALGAAGVADAQILRIDSLTAQKRLVEAGFGIALLPDSSIQEELSAGSLAVLDIKELEVRVPVTVVTRSKGYLGAAAHALLEELRLAAGGVSMLKAPARRRPRSRPRRGQSGVNR